MATDFTTYAGRWSPGDHASFEALCFHRVDETNEPYTGLMQAYTIEDREVAAEIVARAFEMTKDKIALAYAEYEAKKPIDMSPDAIVDIRHSAAEPFALAIAKLCDGPGRVASLVSTMGPDLDLFECNTMHERGGPLNSYYTGPFSSGAVWDSFWFFEDPYGPDSSVSFTTYHITKSGRDYCLWRWPERIEALRKAEDIWKRNFRG